MQICEFFDQVITDCEYYVLVKIDMERVTKLMLELNIDLIIRAIWDAPKMKFRV